jgi:hypothetical protein
MISARKYLYDRLNLNRQCLICGATNNLIQIKDYFLCEEIGKHSPQEVRRVKQEVGWLVRYTMNFGVIKMFKLTKEDLQQYADMLEREGIPHDKLKQHLEEWNGKKKSDIWKLEKRDRIF